MTPGKPRLPNPALTDAQRERLAAGEHQVVAEELLRQGQPWAAGWVFEQIWEFAAAFSAYAKAERWVDALRSALASDRLELLTAAVDQIAQSDPDTQDQALAMLRKRGRHRAVERLLAARNDDPAVRAQALAAAGDPLGAARVLAEAGRAREAFDVLSAGGRRITGDALALAATLCWDLGDAEGAARHAQADLRQAPRPASTALLARALGALGHDLAAQMVLEGSGTHARDETLPGRYRVTGSHVATLTGSAYVGFDRVTLQEVEIHLLLADQPTGDAADPDVQAAIRGFAAASRAAAAIGHPAIRPLLRVDDAAGLVVLPRAEGPTLRALIRPPGMLDGRARARALIAFLLDGLVAAHERGLVHGWLLPSSIATDAAGRPLLGPFGAYHLAGLAATQTGSLEEIVKVTAPELRGSAPPTVASDLFSVGVLLRALMLGSLDDPGGAPMPDASGGPADPSTSSELELAQRLTNPDPDLRPTGSEALNELRRSVVDTRALRRPVHGRHPPNAAVAQPTALTQGNPVTAADTWDDATLDALCACLNPWWQPIVDRAERTIFVAPWPEGSRTLEGDTPRVDWQGVVPKEATDVEDSGLRTALELRLRASSWVATPGGTWMLALDDLLSR